MFLCKRSKCFGSLISMATVSGNNFENSIRYLCASLHSWRNLFSTTGWYSFARICVLKSGEIFSSPLILKCRRRFFSDFFATTGSVLNMLEQWKVFNNLFVCVTTSRRSVLPRREMCPPNFFLSFFYLRKIY